MDNDGDKKKLEALGNAAERHRSQMQRAWEHADVTAGFRSVQHANLEKKAAKRSKSKDDSDSKQ